MVIEQTSLSLLFLDICSIPADSQFNAAFARKKFHTKEYGVAWRGVAWRGVAWRGVAWRGVAKYSHIVALKTALFRYKNPDAIISAR